MNKLVRLALIFPFLVGCNNKETFKIEVEYNESGTLVESSPEYMYKHVKEDLVDSIFYIGDHTCESCAELEGKLYKWCSEKKAMVYYIPYALTGGDGYTYMVETTKDTEMYMWKETMPLPVVYVFVQGYVVFQGDSKTTMPYLKEHIVVINN